MTSKPPIRIAVLASGGGSNLQALIEHFATKGASSGRIALVLSNKSNAGALERAQKAGIRTEVIADPSDGAVLLECLEKAGVELLVLAGYLKLVPVNVIRAFRGKIINVHPALLPAFGGSGMYGLRIHHAVLERGAVVTGVTVHFVDEHYDQGPIIAQWPVPVFASDTPEMLAARVLRIEHALLPLCVEAVTQGVVTLNSSNRVERNLTGTRPEHQPVLQWQFVLENYSYGDRENNCCEVLFPVLSPTSPRATSDS